MEAPRKNYGNPTKLRPQGAMPMMLITDVRKDHCEFSHQTPRQRRCIEFVYYEMHPPPVPRGQQSGGALVRVVACFGHFKRMVKALGAERIEDHQAKRMIMMTKLKAWLSSQDQ